MLIGMKAFKPRLWNVPRDDRFLDQVDQHLAIVIIVQVYTLQSPRRGEAARGRLPTG